MKRLNVSSGDLQRMLPPMPETFERAALHTIEAAVQQKEEPIVKKKLSLGLVLALIIVFLAAVALAVSYWQQTAKDIASMEAENGYYEEWTVEQKVELVRYLVDAGELPKDGDTGKVLDENTPGAEREQLADQIMMDYVDGPVELITFSSILTQIKGNVAYWSMEDKVWYMDMMEETGLAGADGMAFVLPEGQEATEADAIRIAREVFRQAYGVTDSELDAYNVDATFSIVTWETDDYDYYAQGDRMWSVLLDIDTPEWFSVYHADLTSEGRVLAYTHTEGKGEASSRSGKHFLIPGEGDMPEEEALRIAKEALQAAFGLSAADLDRQTARAGFSMVLFRTTGDVPCEIGDRIWTVDFSAGYQVELKNDGTILGFARAMGEDADRFFFEMPLSHEIPYMDAAGGAPAGE
jgi:hypothetical protein